jgi:omega-amidase
MTQQRPKTIAIGQLRMHWTIEGNMAAIISAIELAHHRGASLCVFPELAITGFHRQIVVLAKPGLIAPEISRLQAFCAQKSIAVAIGAPIFTDDGTRFNSVLFINGLGEIALTVSKIGLTPAEATFFAAGTQRPIAKIGDLRCTAVICREVEDRAEVLAQLPPGSVDLIVWPGQMRPDPDKPVSDPPGHVVQAQQIAQSTGAFMVQANWPNALNRPEESAQTGRSAVIAPNGELLFRLPEEAPGVAVFDLGARTFEWYPDTPFDQLPRASSRVVLRRLAPADLRAFQAYRHDANVGRYQGWTAQHDDDAAAFIAEMDAARLFTPGAWVQLGIADGTTHNLIGDIGISLHTGGEKAEIGFTLDPAAQGRGLGAEAVRSAIGLIFEHSSAKQIIAVTDARNAASMRLLERVGMQKIGTADALFRGEACVEHTYVLGRSSG